MAELVVCEHEASKLVGACVGAPDGDVLVTCSRAVHDGGVVHCGADNGVLNANVCVDDLDLVPSCPAVWDPSNCRYCVCVKRKGHKKHLLLRWKGMKTAKEVARTESTKLPLKGCPVALVPLCKSGSGTDTMQGLLVVVFESGRCAWLHPRLAKMQVVGKKTEEEERRLVAQISTHGQEMAIAIWESTRQRYAVKFAAVKQDSISEMGNLELRPPSSSAVLCGMSHLGSRLFVVWSDSSAQTYGPSKHSVGLELLQTHQLMGFDFTRMKRGSRTEDLRTLPLGVSVCMAIGERDLLVVAGPQVNSPGLRYIVFDSKFATVQSTGTVCEDKGMESGPIRLANLQGLQGRVLVTGSGKVAAATFPIKPTTLASLVGSQSLQHGKRKRQASGEDEIDSQALAKLPALGSNGSPLPPHTLLTLPKWAIPLTRPVENGYTAVEAPVAVPIPQDSDLLRVTEADGGKTNGFRKHTRVSELAGPPAVALNPMLGAGHHKLHERTVGLLEHLLDGSAKPDSEVVPSVIQLLQECRTNSVVLTVDLVGLTAAYCAKLQDWTGLRELLASCPLRSLSECCSLPTTTAAAHQYGLLKLLLGHVDHFPNGEMAPLLTHLLSSASDDKAVESQFYNYERIRLSAEAAVHCAEEATGDGFPATLQDAQTRVLGVEGFSPLEVTLHPLLCVPLDTTELADALSELSNAHAGMMLNYLERWLHKLVGLRRSDASLARQSKESGFPNLWQVAEWASCLLSVQLPQMSQHTNQLKVVQRMRQHVADLLKHCRSLTSLRGVVENLLFKSSIPLPDDPLASKYCIELIDLRVSEP
eukprot:evm.model.scf_1070.4 EVM.evm.TU.scf_1070.4   scf_1070:20330-23430(-)